MSFTYHCAIKAIPYKVVLNCKPRSERLDIANCYLNKADIKKHVIDNNQDDLLVVEDRKKQQLREQNKLSVTLVYGIRRASKPSRILGEKEDLTKSKENQTSNGEEKFEEENRFKPISRLKISHFLKTLPIWIHILHVLICQI